MTWAHCAGLNALWQLMNGFIIAYSQVRASHRSTSAPITAVQSNLPKDTKCSGKLTPSSNAGVHDPTSLRFARPALMGCIVVQMPAYWKWLNRITPTTWILYALASNQVLHRACRSADAFHAPLCSAGAGL